jgi:hypothetical protein
MKGTFIVLKPKGILIDKTRPHRLIRKRKVTFPPRVIHEPMDHEYNDFVRVIGLEPRDTIGGTGTKRYNVGIDTVKPSVTWSGGVQLAKSILSAESWCRWLPILRVAYANWIAQHDMFRAPLTKPPRCRYCTRNVFVAQAPASRGITEICG